ncbi:hypothetical protein ABIA85_007914 [Bradyrhizobium sp. LA6.10]
MQQETTIVMIGAGSICLALGRRLHLSEEELGE